MLAKLTLQADNDQEHRMHEDTDTAAAVEQAGTQDGTTARAWRDVVRARTLQRALRKRAAGVPTYSVPEAAELMSISQEFLYRLVQADGFPAARMRVPGAQGRYVVPAQAVELLLRRAIETGGCVESAAFTEEWQTAMSGGGGA